MAADRREFDGLRQTVDPWRPCQTGLRWAVKGAIKGRQALLAANGPGRQNAAQAVTLAARQFQLSAVVSTGYAGALDRKLRVGDIFLADKVIEFQSRLEYAVRLPECGLAKGVGTLLTVDEVIQQERAKSRLHELGAGAVDMEASAVAAEADRHNLPFYCVRSISDEVDTRFEIDFNRARRGDGTFSGWRIAAQAGLHPARWRNLVQLRRNAREASMALGAFLGQCSF